MTGSFDDLMTKVNTLIAHERKINSNLNSSALASSA